MLAPSLLKRLTDRLRPKPTIITVTLAQLQAQVPSIAAKALQNVSRRRFYTGLHLPGNVTLFAPAFIVSGCESTGTAGEKYMTRYRLFDAPGLGVYLHIFHRSDVGGDYHNHPWPFTSYILSGGYVEEVPTVYPTWQTDPDGAAAFAATIKRTPAYTDPETPQNAGPFCGNYCPDVEYPTGSVVCHKGAYSVRTEGVGWKSIAPDLPRLLDVRPLTRAHRAASHVHRVRLHTRPDETPRPAVTLVIRGGRGPAWGFFRGLRFIAARDYFKENGC